MGVLGEFVGIYFELSDGFVGAILYRPFCKPEYVYIGNKCVLTVFPCGYMFCISIRAGQAGPYMEISVHLYDLQYLNFLFINTG